MKDWAGFWESDTHELKQISEETGVPVELVKLWLQQLIG